MISVVDVAARKVVRHDAVLTPDGRFLYATLRKANRIAVLRTEDLEVVTEIPQPGYPDLVVMANDGTKRSSRIATPTW